MSSSPSSRIINNEEHSRCQSFQMYSIDPTNIPEVCLIPMTSHLFLGTFTYVAGIILYLSASVSTVLCTSCLLFKLRFDTEFYSCQTSTLIPRQLIGTPLINTYPLYRLTVITTRQRLAIGGSYFYIFRCSKQHILLTPKFDVYNM